MKKINFISILLFLFFLLSSPKQSFSQNVGIGTAAPNASAKLDITSTNSGLLPPRMTTVQRNSIVSPTPGLMIFNTSTQSIEIYTIYGWTKIKAEIAGANRLIGGSRDDVPMSIRIMPNGGYVIAGYSSSSANGDVSNVNHGIGSDYWIVTLDQYGNIDNDRLLGGNGDDIATDIQLTSDGGLIIAGYSYSSANGDVTGVNHGSSDYWIVKLDASGNIVWNKLLGGSGYDEAYSIQQTADGGYIVAGSSTSSANGDVTSVSHGAQDYWIVKLDASGNIQWNKLLGASNMEIPSSIQQTSDGGYIIAGITRSQAGGDVTNSNHGNSLTTDAWIVKLNSLGGIVWNKTLGSIRDDGISSIIQTSDGGYIAAGSFTGDYGIIKLDAAGNGIWDRLLGGSGSDEAKSIQQTSDGGYIVAGSSSSSASGNVTGTNHGSSDYWIVKLDALGNIIWNKLYGGNNTDIALSIRQKPGGGFIVVGYSASSDNGDVTVPNHGIGSDYWILRLDANGNIF